MAVLEIAVFSPEAAEIAVHAGADRIEICIDYQAGGITPKMEELITFSKIGNVPKLAMIRPRKGDFCYSLSEIWQILVAIEQCKKLEINGVVFGVLNSKNEIDTGALKEIMHTAEGMQTTFHRAFDHTSNLYQTMDILIDNGVTRILSAAWKERDISYAADLKNHAKDHIFYMPGGGVRSSNIHTLINAGFTEIHTAAITGNNELPDPSEITKMRRLLHT